MDIRFLGHAAFALEPTATRRVLVDPFLTGNPKAAATADEVDADAILLTHGHADHIGDTVDIAKRTGAPVVAIVELAGEIGEELGGDHQVLDPNLGGTVEFDWGSVRARRRPGTRRRRRRAPSTRRPAWSSRSAASASTTSATPRCSATCSSSAARPARRRADVHRRPLHDGPLRRGRGGASSSAPTS